jgi:hypothetical protein
MNTKVKVVIPIYKSQLSSNELLSLDNTMQKLSRYPIVFLINEQVDIAPFLAKYPQAETLTVSDDWLGARRGIQGYNEMMMSKDFYELFPDTEFILICHIDAWIFRDELEQWCDAGYDIVAAPWPTRPHYRVFPFKHIIALRKKFAKSDKITRSQMRDGIGNGGLCLRRVKVFRDACVKYADTIQEFIARSPEDVLYNEDLFWALIPKELKYPSVKEALKFSYDLKPKVCHKLNHNNLPMGCHGYTHSSRIKFWQQFIPNIDTADTKN